MISPADYVEISGTHRTNETWYLVLAVDFGAETSTELASASASARLRAADGTEITFSGAECAVFPVEKQIVMTKPAASFAAAKTGAYAGDLLLQLGSGQKIVTHIFSVKLVKGVA